MPDLNRLNQELGSYASKVISAKAKRDPSIINLSIGEPAFGPPEHLRVAFENEDLTYDGFVRASKEYEQSLGMPLLREAIAEYYARRYGMRVDADRELLVTHGGVEAIALAILATTEPDDTVLITDPTYMLYQRAARSVGRRCASLPRAAGNMEFFDLLDAPTAETREILNHGKTLIVNSPENPTGYVLAESDWAAIAKAVADHDLWLVHDEVYDTMAFDRPHWPARARDDLLNRSIIVNSFSKKFGVPGLRIGWICAPAAVIDLASKLHDYLYLGVNILFERLALRMLSDKHADQWLANQATTIAERARTIVGTLNSSLGYDWRRRPMGAMFAFPQVEALYSRIPNRFKGAEKDIGLSVSSFLLDEAKVATIPGSIYGASCADSIRIVLCPSDAVFSDGLKRLSSITF